MVGEAPPFWWQKPDWQSYALSPLAWLYGAVAGRRLLRANPPTIAAPVLCIGNFTVGGAGKTPTAIALAQVANKRGLKPGIVSRGYGGNYQGLHVVDADRDSAAEVGDEPLLLACHAPVVLCPDRAKAASQLLAMGCDFIIMDDGFQSARLHADFALLVVDGARGIGNGYVIPAGPLRAPLNDQMQKTDALLRIGEGEASDLLIRQAGSIGKTIYEARLAPSSEGVVSGRRFLAFAGIGNPEKFYASVAQAGGDVVETRSFPDHHAFAAVEIHALMERAQSQGLGLITTAKDHVRLKTMSDVPDAFLSALTVLNVALECKQPDALDEILDQAIARYKHRIEN